MVVSVLVPVSQKLHGAMFCLTCFLPCVIQASSAASKATSGPTKGSPLPATLSSPWRSTAHRAPVDTAAASNLPMLSGLLPRDRHSTMDSRATRASVPEVTSRTGGHVHHGQPVSMRRRCEHDTVGAAEKHVHAGPEGVWPPGSRARASYGSRPDPTSTCDGLPTTPAIFFFFHAQSCSPVISFLYYLSLSPWLWWDEN